MSPVEAVWSHPRSSTLPERTNCIGEGMYFGLGEALMRSSPWQRCPSQWCPEILQTHGWWVGGLIPWSMRSTRWSLCCAGTKDKETGDWGESCFFQAKDPLPGLIVQRPAPGLFQGTMWYEGRIPCNRGNSDTVGFCHPGVPEISWCLWCQGFAWWPRAERVKAGHAVYSGQTPSQWHQTRHVRVSSGCGRNPVQVDDVPRIVCDSKFLMSSFYRYQRDQLIWGETSYPRQAPLICWLWSSAWLHDHIGEWCIVALMRLHVCVMYSEGETPAVN